MPDFEFDYPGNYGRPAALDRLQYCNGPGLLTEAFEEDLRENPVLLWERNAKDSY